MLAIAACAALAVLTGCPTDGGGGGGGGGGGAPAPADTASVQTLASNDVVIKITKTNTQPRAAISAKTGDYYWVYKAGDLINRGTVSVGGSAITFKSNSGGSSFKLTLTPGNGTYTLTGSIPNSKGPAISGLPSFGVAKSIKITGITQTDTMGEGAVFLFTQQGNWDTLVAREVYHVPHITNGELLADLYVASGGDATDKRWTGSGEYYIQLMIAGPAGWEDDGAPYHHHYWWTRSGATAKYNIQDALTTINFSEFQ